jgi:hypothetical protein
MEWWQWVSLILFLGGIAYMIIVVSQTAGRSTTKNDMLKAITNVTIINGILIGIMAGIAYFYIDADKNAQRPYIILITHIVMIMSIISVSTTSLHQLKILPAQAQQSTTTPPAACAATASCPK